MNERRIRPHAAQPDHIRPQWATTPARFLALSLFWLPVSLFWSAMLVRVLPARVLAFAGPAHSGSHLAVISTCGAVMGLLVQIVVGPISDACTGRWGRRRPFLFAGTLLATATMLAFAHAHSFAGLVLAFVGIQLFLNIATGPYQALIPDQAPPEKQGVASGFMGVMQLLGEAGGPVAAGLLVLRGTAGRQEHGIATLMLLVAALLIAFMLLTVVTVPDVPFQRGDQQITSRIRDSYAPHIAEHPNFYRLLVSRAVYNVGFYTALDYLSYYVTYSLHAGPQHLLWIQEVALGGALLGTMPAGVLADRVSKKTIIYVSSGFSVVAGLAFALAPSVNFATGMALLFGMGFGMFRAVDWAFATNLLPPGGGAKYMSIWSLSTMAPQVVAPAFGVAADAINGRFGMGMGYRAAMFATLVYTLIGTALISLVQERFTPAERAQPAVPGGVEGS